MRDVVVVGAGLAGLVSAIKLAREGAKVSLLTKGLGGLQLSQGTIDVLGYDPDRVAKPMKALDGWISAHSDHPYARLGSDGVRRGLEYGQQVLGDLVTGDVERNIMLPTAVGAIRPTCLAQPTMTAGEVLGGRRFVIAGFRQLKDFYPDLVAANLSRQSAPDGGDLAARAVIIDLPAVGTMADSSALTYARAMDDPAYRARLATALAPLVGDEDAVGLPAILGLHSTEAHEHLEAALDKPVFEIPLPPPGVPGMRLNERLTALAKAAGVRVIVGSSVTSFESSGARVEAVIAAAAGRPVSYRARDFIYAPGGFESGALTMDSYGKISESIFDLPLAGLGDDLVNADSWSDQRLFAVGVDVDEQMRPLNGSGEPVFDNLFTAGGILAGALRWTEKSGEGIALGTAVRAAESIAKEA